MLGLIGTGSPIFTMPSSRQIFLMCRVPMHFKGESCIFCNGSNKDADMNQICASFRVKLLDLSFVKQLATLPSLLYSDTIVGFPPSSLVSITFTKLLLPSKHFISYWLILPQEYTFTLTNPTACRARNTLSSQYQKSLRVSRSATQLLPLFLDCFSLRFIFGSALISVAFLLLRPTRDSIALFLSTGIMGGVFAKFEVEVGQPASRASMCGRGLSLVNAMELFQESLMPLSVKSMSSSDPNHCNPALRSQTWACSSSLPTNRQSESQSLWQRASACPSVPRVQSSLATNNPSASSHTSNILATPSFFCSFNFFRQATSSDGGFSIILNCMGIPSQKCVAGRQRQGTHYQQVKEYRLCASVYIALIYQSNAYQLKYTVWIIALSHGLAEMQLFQQR